MSAKPLRPHQRHVHGVGDRPQVDGVAGPVLPVLARAVRRLLEEDHAERPLAGLDRVADRHLQRRILARVALLVPRRDEPARAAAAVHVHAERLGRADDDVRAPGARRREHAEADRVDAGDRLRAGGAGELGDLRRVGLDDAEEGRALEIDGGGPVGELFAKIVQVDSPRLRVVRDRDDLDVVPHLRRRAVVRGSPRGAPGRSRRGRAAGRGR